MRQFRPALRDYDLTEQQWRILRALTAVEAIEVTELARVAFLLGPSLSRILRDMERRRLIERKAAKADLRRGRGIDLAERSRIDRGCGADLGGNLRRDHPALRCPQVGRTAGDAPMCWKNACRSPIRIRRAPLWGG